MQLTSNSSFTILFWFDCVDWLLFRLREWVSNDFEIYTFFCFFAASHKCCGFGVVLVYPSRLFAVKIRNYILFGVSVAPRRLRGIGIKRFEIHGKLFCSYFFFSRRSPHRQRNRHWFFFRVNVIIVIDHSFPLTPSPTEKIIITKVKLKKSIYC